MEADEEETAINEILFEGDQNFVRVILEVYNPYLNRCRTRQVG